MLLVYSVPSRVGKTNLATHFESGKDASRTSGARRLQFSMPTQMIIARE
jgi:hypothetical protein